MNKVQQIKFPTRHIFMETRIMSHIYWRNRILEDLKNSILQNPTKENKKEAKKQYQIFCINHFDKMKQKTRRGFCKETKRMFVRGVLAPEKYVLSAKGKNQLRVLNDMVSCGFPETLIQKLTFDSNYKMFPVGKLTALFELQKAGYPAEIMKELSVSKINRMSKELQPERYPLRTRINKGYLAFQKWRDDKIAKLVEPLYSKHQKDNEAQEIPRPDKQQSEIQNAYDAYMEHIERQDTAELSWGMESMEPMDYSEEVRDRSLSQEEIEGYLGNPFYEDDFLDENRDGIDDRLQNLEEQFYQWEERQQETEFMECFERG